MRDENIRIDYQVYIFSSAEWLKYIAIGAGLGCFAVWICYHSVLGAPVAAAVCFYYVRAKKKELGVQRRKNLNYHFRFFLTSLHTNMFAGYSLENSVKNAAREIEQLYGKKDVLSRELHDIVRQMGFGKRIEELFLDLGQRSHVEDIRNFGEVIFIAKRTGGDMSRVLESTWRNLSEKIDTQQEIDTILASRRYEQAVMSFMPAAVILYLRLTFRGFVERMYGNTLGVVIMTICLAVYFLALWIGRKMLGGKI